MGSSMLEEQSAFWHYDDVLALFNEQEEIFNLKIWENIDKNMYPEYSFFCLDFKYKTFNILSLRTEFSLFNI